jgi:hypothetical protein
MRSPVTPRSQRLPGPGAGHPPQGAGSRVVVVSLGFFMTLPYLTIVNTDPRHDCQAACVAGAT